jgi:type II secretory pathway pseudopilin PulG
MTGTIQNLKRAWARRADDEAGVTLVELVVVTAVMSLVLVMVLNFLMNATWVTARADADTKAEQDGITALRTVAEDVRSAKTLSACTGFTFDQCVTVEILKATASGVTCPKRIATYRVISGNLNQTYNDYAANCTTVTKTVNRTLIAGVQSASIFTYYGADGLTPLNLTVSTDVAKVPATPVVKIALSVQYRKNTAAIPLSTFASLRNAQRY